MKPSPDSLKQRAAQQRSEIRQTTEELVSSIGDIRRQFTLEVQLKKHFTASALLVCALAFSLGYRASGIVGLGR